MFPPKQAGRVESEKTAVTSQGLGKHVPEATHTHATIEKLLDRGFYTRPVS
jgi:hypothetical protein